eukprot:67858-Prorocentrum_minimum.AAC.2
MSDPLLTNPWSNALGYTRGCAFCGSRGDPTNCVAFPCPASKSSANNWGKNSPVVERLNTTSPGLVMTHSFNRLQSETPPPETRLLPLTSTVSPLTSTLSPLTSTLLPLTSTLLLLTSKLLPLTSTLLALAGADGDAGEAAAHGGRGELEGGQARRQPQPGARGWGEPERGPLLCGRRG